MPKVVTIIGPESTGKSHLAKELSECYNGKYVPEVARAYLQTLNRNYTFEDVEKMAYLQLEQQKNAINQSDKDLIFCDTNLEVYKVWFEHSYQYCPEWILREIAKDPSDLYLLCNIDIPWEPDPLREHPHPWQREYFYNIYKDIVIQSGVDVGFVKGIGKKRTLTARGKIDTIF